MKKSTPHRLRAPAAAKAKAAANTDKRDAPQSPPRRERPAKWKCPRCGTRKLLRGHRHKQGDHQPG